MGRQPVARARLEKRRSPRCLPKGDDCSPEHCARKIIHAAAPRLKPNRRACELRGGAPGNVAEHSADRWPSPSRLLGDNVSVPRSILQLGSRWHGCGARFRQPVVGMRRFERGARYSRESRSEESVPSGPASLQSRSQSRLVPLRCNIRIASATQIKCRALSPCKRRRPTQVCVKRSAASGTSACTPPKSTSVALRSTRSTPTTEYGLGSQR